MPVRSCSASSNSRLPFLAIAGEVPSPGSDRVAGHPSRIVPPSSILPGGSWRIVFQRLRQFLKGVDACCLGIDPGAREIPADEVRFSGSMRRVSRERSPQLTQVAGVAQTILAWLRIRSMSRMPLSWSCSSRSKVPVR